MTNFGFGTPVDDVSGDDLRRFLKASNIVALLERRTDPSLAAPIRHAAGVRVGLCYGENVLRGPLSSIASRSRLPTHEPTASYCVGG